MHELAITEGIIETAVPAALKGGAKKILKVNLKIGELSGVFPEYIQENFDLLSKGTIAEGAVLNFAGIPIMIKCRGCGHEGEIKKGNYECPKCKSMDFKITAGREYFVESVEVE